MQKEKRIMTNALALGLRVAAVSFINLMAVRFVLQALGATDYGVYNAVASLVMMGSCVLSVLTTASQRFYSFALGRDDKEQMQQIFTVTRELILLIIFILLALMASLGLWLVGDAMDIPDAGRENALWVLLLLFGSLAMQMMQVPFLSLILAHEKMHYYALFSVADSVLRLIFALLIFLASEGDRMIFYAAGMTVTSATIMMLYRAECRASYPDECCCVRFTNKEIIGQLMGFSGFSLYSAVAGMGLIQGSALLLNFYFGPLANTSFAVAVTLFTAFNALANSIAVPYRPAITKAFAREETDSLKRLYRNNTVVLLGVLLLAAVPLCCFMPQIMELWLGHVSGETVLFAQLMIVYTVCLSMHHPITAMMQASGQLKLYTLVTESIMLLNVPITWALFAHGLPQHWVFVSMISLCIVAHLARIVILHRNKF